MRLGDDGGTLCVEHIAPSWLRRFGIHEGFYTAIYPGAAFLSCHVLRSLFRMLPDHMQALDDVASFADRDIYCAIERSKPRTSNYEELEIYDYFELPTGCAFPRNSWPSLPTQHYVSVRGLAIACKDGL